MSILNHVILNMPKDLQVQKTIGAKINQVPDVRFTGGSTEGFITVEMDRRSTSLVRKALGPEYQNAPIITYRTYYNQKERERAYASGV